MSLTNRRSTVILYSDSEGFYSHSIRIVLFEKDVQADIIEVDPEIKPEALLNVNPYNTLPTLVDKELSLYEPKIILEYLDERFPHPPLMPVYPVARAKTRSFLYRIEQEWFSSVKKILDSSNPQSQEIQKERKTLMDKLISISSWFEENDYFMGNDLTLVDCLFAPLLWRLPVLGIELPKKETKPLFNYMFRLFERDAFVQSLTEEEQKMRAGHLKSVGK